MKRTPSSPPRAASVNTWSWSTSRPQTKRAGMVKITPAASDSPAEPTVCTMLVSRTLPVWKARKTAMAMTAAGMDALTVRPTRRPR